MFHYEKFVAEIAGFVKFMKAPKILDVFKGIIAAIQQPFAECLPKGGGWRCANELFE
ncbi:hypothetical protein JOC94_003990 [Bacillus thermophilus]|uniref:Uncharacterized protein n=1 Tax=Siminovitchia thermophila TaxID=1245522 RepID=A0ABS2RBD5_9BACI|nr:hypothetical protein [Siminovitchia thermophila]MBM7716966.1 hypothetical protein [Siminovitchia thermophila]